LACLLAADLETKTTLSETTAQQWRAGHFNLSPSASVQLLVEPGRPETPRLVAPSQVKRRNVHKTDGHGALIHALAHIEFNAINLAWDAVYRFQNMPRAYYDDWVKVAAEETYHFTLLRQRLAELGFAYGDFDAHDGLWEAAVDTADDVLVRMALVPRVLEARGLDATPNIARKLQAIHDDSSLKILEIIFHDEIGHVSIGTKWFRHLCAQRGLPSDETFLKLIEERFHGALRGPISEGARRQAGFSDRELLGVLAKL